MTTQNVILPRPAPVWGGGSGSLNSSNWIGGYTENISANGPSSFSSWMYSTIESNGDAIVYFVPSITALGVTNTNVGIGGTLTGTLELEAVLFESNSGYLLTGEIEGFTNFFIGGTVGAGILTVSGGGAAFDTLDDIDVNAFAGEAPSSLTIDSGGVAYAGAIVVAGVGVGSIVVSGAGSLLDADGLGAGYGILIGGGGNTNLTIEDGATAEDVRGVLVGYFGDGSLNVTGSGSDLAAGGTLALGYTQGTSITTGTLSVTDGGSVSFEGNATLANDSSIFVDSTSSMEIGEIDGDAVVEVGTIVVGSFGTLSGNGTVESPVQNNGAISAAGGTLEITGAVTGIGFEQISSGSALELDAPVGSGQVISFEDSTGTLILGDPQDFHGSIIGAQAGDEILLPSIPNGNSVIAAMVVDLNGIPTLQIFEGTNNNPSVVLPNIAFGDTAADDDLVGKDLLLSSSTDGTDTILTVPTGSQPGLVLNEQLDSSVTGITNPSTLAGYEYAADTAAVFFESEILNSLTVAVNFGWGEVNANGTPESVTGAGASYHPYFSTTYTALYNNLMTADTTSNVQKAAFASLPATDPTNGASFLITSALANALHLTGSNVGGSVGLSSSSSWSWSQQNVAALSYDAVGVFEHELSEVLGRVATGGANGVYSLLDLYRYAAPGVRDEPFVGSSYDPTADSYFSYNGTNLSLQFETPSDVNGGADVADWYSSSLSPTDDAFADESLLSFILGRAAPVSLTDLQVMNVLGYDIGDLSCYAMGTQILTIGGEVAIESLRPGNQVITLTGKNVPVIWIGRRDVDCLRYRDRKSVWPVRVSEDAFGNGLPRRQLRLSPDHAVFVDGALIPVRYLLNGRTIVQEPTDQVTYYHIELPQHDIVLAEGLPAESYFDTGDRAKFEGSDGPPMRLYPNFPALYKDVGCLREAECYAPVVITGPQLEAIRRRLDGISTRIDVSAMEVT